MNQKLKLLNKDSIQEPVEALKNECSYLENVLFDSRSYLNSKKEELQNLSRQASLVVDTYESENNESPNCRIFSTKHIFRETNDQIELIINKLAQISTKIHDFQEIFTNKDNINEVN